MLLEVGVDLLIFLVRPDALLVLRAMGVVPAFAALLSAAALDVDCAA